MRKFMKLILPTLVLLMIYQPSANVAYALPTVPSPDYREPKNANDHRPLDEFKTKTIDITEPAPDHSGQTLREREAAFGYFYKYHHELGLQVGSLYDTESDGNQNHVHETISVRYLYPDHKLQSWELNATLISDSTAAFSYSRRFIASQDRFRPYSALGFGLHLFADEAPLANFLRWRQYELRGASGFEYTSQWLTMELQWRAEIAIAAGARSQRADASLGLVWPW